MRSIDCKKFHYVTPAEQEIFIKGNWSIEWEQYALDISKLQGGIAIDQIEFLKKVISDNLNVGYYHFGDIDIGGFLIHKHLCRETSK